MNPERVKMLERFVKEDPTDPFNRYALGLELAKSDKRRAREIFDRLILVHPDYVPTYYQAGLLYLDLSLHEEASHLIIQGIAEARKQNNIKAANELKALLDELT